MPTAPVPSTAYSLTPYQKWWSGVGIFGMLVLILQALTDSTVSPFWSLGVVAVGVLGYVWAGYSGHPAGIKNDGNLHRGITARGAVAWVAAAILTAFYVLLYWFPTVLGLGHNGSPNTGLIGLFDPFSMALKGQPASEWFVYGVLYTCAIVVFGLKFIAKYRHNRYQVWRTVSVIFFQTGFAFLLPELMQALRYPYHDFKNMWPLNYYFFDEWHLRELTSSGTVGLLMLGSGLAMIFVVSPVLTYFYGKRWYCSWVCGCGGLAETAGDPFRHLSDKSQKSWKIERWSIHIVLAFALVMTVAVLFSFFHNAADAFWVGKTAFIAILTVLLGGGAAMLRLNRRLRGGLSRQARRIGTSVMLATLALAWLAFATGTSEMLFIIGNYHLRSWYGFLVGAAFSGVIGVGFYPLMGTRVWCRFGCPMAAILGVQQKIFSRFRITVNGGQCISCGNCSTYCEMGIDVRAYAQRGQDIVRASCVGCGVCSAVCPRGVLRLENGPVATGLTLTDGRATLAD